MSEPRASLYKDNWHAARQRVGVFASLLDHMERGWHALRPLQLWVEQHADRQQEGDDYAHLLGFADGDVLDVFLMMGRGVAALIPGWPGWESEADPGDIDGWLDTLVRYTRILRLASNQAGVPEEFRAIVRSLVESWESGQWAEQMAVLLASAGAIIAASPDGEGG